MKWRGDNKMTYKKIATTQKEVEELMIPSGGVRQKLDGVVDSVPPDRGCEVLHWELTHELIDESDSEILLIVMMPKFC